VTEEQFYNPDNFAILPMGLLSGKQNWRYAASKGRPYGTIPFWKKLNNVQLIQWKMRSITVEIAPRNLTANVANYSISYLNTFRYRIHHPSIVLDVKNSWF
jgi:hypothetical protein